MNFIQLVIWNCKLNQISIFKVFFESILLCLDGLYINIQDLRSHVRIKSWLG